jgi:hypothetical protein
MLDEMDNALDEGEGFAGAGPAIIISGAGGCVIAASWLALGVGFKTEYMPPKIRLYSVVLKRVS